MEAEATATFFKTFSFDTLLALISCIAGIIALFLGGTAYHNYNIIKGSFNDEKNYNNGSIDSSQKAAGDIYNQACDVNALTTLTSANFSESLRQAYDFFEQQTSNNLHKIIDEANRLIQENKVNIASYTKIDWINIYFESAKNASDIYMQNVWAKVLAKELESPDSFSYKTLDILKNMSITDFKLFEKLCSFQFDGRILGEQFHTNYISWVDLLKLQEFGLINLESSAQSFKVQARAHINFLIFNSRYVITMRNESEKEVLVQYNIYILTTAATELISIATFAYRRDYIISVAMEIKEKCKSQVETELYQVNSVSGDRIFHNKENLLTK